MSKIYRLLVTVFVVSVWTYGEVPLKDQSYDLELVIDSSSRDILETKESNEKLVKMLYTGLSGFIQIPQEELDYIKNKCGLISHVYGEITYKGWQEILDDLKLTAEDVFFDLGCGIGKIVIQTYLMPIEGMKTIKEARGIEICEARYKQGVEAKERLLKLGLFNKNSPLIFEHGDIIDSDLSNATVLFVSSICFEEEFMNLLVEKIAQLKPGTRFLSLDQLPEGYQNKGLVLTKVYNVEMSWTPDSTSPVYLYSVMSH